VKQKEQITVELNDSEHNDDGNSCANSAMAKSTFTRMTKAACGALNKHCTMGDCGGKLITGSNWARHTKQFHSAIPKDSWEYTACSGAGDCHYC
jgi:hypothetical protein